MEELVESILDYVRADYTDYAIMINGEWGSGKTYFWNHKIRNKIENMHINGKQYTTIYMSFISIQKLIFILYFEGCSHAMNHSL